MFVDEDMRKTNRKEFFFLTKKGQSNYIMKIHAITICNIHLEEIEPIYRIQIADLVFRWLI